MPCKVPTEESAWRNKTARADDDRLEILESEPHLLLGDGGPR